MEPLEFTGNINMLCFLFRMVLCVWVVSWLHRDLGPKVGAGRRYKPGQLKPQDVWRQK